MKSVSFFSSIGLTYKTSQNSCCHKKLMNNVNLLFFETGKIYICGGFNGIECLNSTETYDPETNQWTLVSPMNNSRSGLGVIAYKRDVYALGGFNGIARMCSAERYCPRSNKWRTIADMGGPRSNFAVEVTGVSISNPPPLSDCWLKPFYIKGFLSDRF